MKKRTSSPRSSEWKLGAATCRCRARRRAGLCLLIAGLVTVPAVGHDEILIQIAAVSAEIEQHPGDAKLLWRRGELYRLHEDWDAAMADFERASAADSSFDDIHVARARLFLDLHLPQAANAAVAIFLKKTPDNPIALRVRARSWEALEKFDLAAADYRHVVELEPEPQPDDYLSWAYAELKTGDGGAKRALRAIEAGTEKFGSLVTLHSAAIDIAIEAQDYAAALAQIDAVMAKLRRKEVWLYRRGEVFEKAGKPEAALAAYCQAQEAINALSSAMRAGPMTVKLAADVAAAIDRLRASLGKTAKAGESGDKP